MAAMLIVSCESEPVSPPIVSLTTSADITVQPEEVFSIDVSASPGDSPLKTVTVYEDGTIVPFSRLTYNGSSASANPALLFGDDVDGLTWSIDVVAQSSVGAPVVFEVEVADDAGLKGSVFVNVTTNGVAPMLTTTSGTSISTGVDMKHAFKLTGVKGSGNLVSIEVRQNNQFVDKSNVFWKEISMSVDENPFTLLEEDQDGFEDEDLFIMTPETAGIFNYTVLLTDEFGLTAQLDFEVSTGTAVEIREGVLLNSAGPEGTGGLDLETGMGTGSMNENADIKDNGIDEDLPPESNWLRTISPANNASMKYLIAGQGGLPEGFTFANIAFKEDLPALFGNGIDLIDGATGVVMPGDVFIVERDGDYYLLEVIQVSTDPNNNEDSYTFDIKY